MAKRVNIILPEATISTIDRLVKKGGRSGFIDRAVRHYLVTRSAEGLGEQLKRATIRDRDLGGEITADWTAVDQESWKDIDSKKRAEATFPKRGEIYLTTLDPAVGHEIRKTRPAIVIQNDVINEHGLTTMVAPITSTVRLPLSPVHVLIEANELTGLSVSSVAVLAQIRTVDRRRLVKRLGTVDPETLKRIEEAMKIGFGLELD